MTGPAAVVVDGRSLSLAQLLSVARDGAAVALDPSALAGVAASRAAVERAVAAHRPVYGVTTGFGALSHVVIPPERGRELQASLLRSHASGAGPPLPTDVVRALTLLRLNSLAAGRSGVRVEVLDRLADVLNHGLVPWIPAQGSVGASGDLAPLAHLALALLGEGAFVAPGSGRPEAAGPVLARAGIPRLEPVEKEGVALLNGTALMAAYLALGVADARALLDGALVAAALSFDALTGNPIALDDRLGVIRRSADHRAIAGALRALLDGSRLAVVPAEWTGQDPYTLRCLPQVLGAVRYGIGVAEAVATDELNAVTDNPVVFDGDDWVNGGNFHGQPLAFALDALAIAVQYVASFAERRIARLVHPDLNRGLPAFLAPEPGVSSGLMVPQYLAAALVNENETLVHPASTASLSTSADQEDFVSMGPWAGAKLHRVLANARTVVAVEWIVAGQALELRRPRTGGRGSEAALGALRARVAPWTRDRSPADDIARVADGLRDGALVGAVRATVPF
ncbi:MAG TPA: histidine ammonia-lyase [Thermoplasmata archaeon]|nr:histidine ammonia-lyase [Thermoplasmata archaeon]